MQKIFDFINKIENDDSIQIGENLKKMIYQYELNDIMDVINSCKQYHHKCCYYYRMISKHNIKVLTEKGFTVKNPQRGINYGKTWPGMQIIWN